MRVWFALLLASTVVAPTALAADDEYEDLDGGGKTKGRPSSDEDEDEESRPSRAEIVREIERGFYMKSNVGVTSYLLTYGAKPGYGPILRGGTALSMAVGQDFVDNEKNSIGWEFAFYTGIHNGLNWQLTAQGIRAGAIPVQASIQGDTRTLAFHGNIEYSAYPSRRIGIGVRAGGGILFAPLLLGKLQFTEEVVPEFGNSLPVHQIPHPTFFGGPTFEYYTKLSHFSIGADIDVSYTLNFDLGVSGTGYMKYTF